MNMNYLMNIIKIINLILKQVLTNKIKIKKVKNYLNLKRGKIYLVKI
jgi:hypothetical protein